MADALRTAVTWFSPAQRAWHRETHMHARETTAALSPQGRAATRTTEILGILTRAAGRRRGIPPPEEPRGCAAGVPFSCASTCGQLQTQQQYTTHNTMKAVRTHEPGGVASTPARIEPHLRRRMCPAHAAGAAGSAEPLRGLPPRLPPLLALGVYVL
jgi:hypothetical protein